MIKGYEYQSDFAKKYVAEGRERGREEGRVEGHIEGLAEGRSQGLFEGRIEGRIEGHMEGRIEGRIEGRVEGRIEGRTEGRAEEAARAVLTVLRARGLAVSEAVRERILSQKDPERLERWLEKAAVAASAAEALDEPS